MIIKNTNKKDILIKQAYVEFGKLVDIETGEQLDMAEIISRVYGADQEVKISVTATATEEVDYSSIESEDSDVE